MAVNLLGVAEPGGLLGSILPKREPAKPPSPDFDFFEIIEFVNGRARPADSVRLFGRFLPHQPFEYGGTQRIVREDYPGASEPTIQVLGPRESDVTIRGHFKVNKLPKSSDFLRDVAYEYQKLMDAIRIRGNLCKLTLNGAGGEWVRYGFVEETKFRLRTLQHIEYECSFVVVGFNPPKGFRIIDDGDFDLVKINKDLIRLADSELAKATNFPEPLPQSLTDVLNNAIGGVAEVTSALTGLVDGVINDAQQLLNTANRAIGLIKNLRATISRASRNIGALGTQTQGLAGSFRTQGDATRNTLINFRYLHSTQRGFASLQSLLAQYQKQFEIYSRSVPLVRHLIRDGDTLQSISQQYYNSPDNWKAILDHNKLETTQLVRGRVLEIPRL
jgi:hypothetical protein